MATVTEIDDSAELVGRTLTGEPGRWDVKSVQTLNLPASALIAQRVRDADGTILVYRSLPAANDVAARVLLDNEIRALARLSHAFPHAQPQPFPILVGYNMDTRDPWALVTDYQGNPAAEVVTNLMRPELGQFAGNVFRAVAHAGLVEVVHGSLSMNSLYMTSTSVQIVTFERAAFAGEPRPGRHGAAGREDDVLAAGKILYEAFTGFPPSDDQPDLTGVGWLRSRVADVFAPPRERPSANAVLERFGVRKVPEIDDDLASGRAAFDETRQREHPPESRTVRLPPVPDPRGRKRWSPRTMWLVVGLLLVVAALVLAMQGGVL
jgi:hypothetical protein